MYNNKGNPEVRNLNIKNPEVGEVGVLLFEASDYMYIYIVSYEKCVENYSTRC